MVSGGADGAAREGGAAVRGAGDRLAAALADLGRWSVFVHDGDPRHLSIRREDHAGDTLLRTSEGLADQAVACAFVGVVQEVIEARAAPGSSVRMSDEELWMVYDLVAARVTQIDAAELASMSNCGGEPWRLLARKLRNVLPPVADVPA